MIEATFIKKSGLYYVSVSGHGNINKPYINERYSIPEGNFDVEVMRILRSYSKVRVKKIDNEENVLF